MARRVLVSTSSFAATGEGPLRRLEEAGCQVRLNPYGRRLRPAETVALLDGVEGLIAGTETLDRQVLERAPALRAVSRCGAGLDNLDLEAAAELGVEVRRTGSAHADAVAELTLAGVLDLLRRVAAADRALRAGAWEKPMGRLLRGKTVGIVGLGTVGRRLVELLAPFDVACLACDPRRDEAFAERHGVRYVPLDELLGAADVVTLHLSSTAGDDCLIGRRQLERMRPGALLVNTARGGLVDEAALCDALAAGKLGGVFLDVFGQEPYRGPLIESANVLLTPHIGSYAAESRLVMEMEAVENLLDLLDRQKS